MRIHSLSLFLTYGICIAEEDDDVSLDRCRVLCSSTGVCPGASSTCDSAKGICSDLYYTGDGLVVYGRGTKAHAVRCPIVFERWQWFIDVADAFEAIHRSTMMVGKGNDDYHKAVIISKKEEIEFHRHTLLELRNFALMGAFRNLYSTYMEYNKYRQLKMQNERVDNGRFHELRSALSGLRDRYRMSQLGTSQPGL